MNRAHLFFLELRPKQWLKNLFVIAPLIFTNHVFLPAYWLRGALGFLLFGLASSAVYLINDVLDREKDALHPVKCLRPVASGAIYPQEALLFASLLLMSALLGSLLLNLLFACALFLYFCLGMLYSFYWRQVFLLDILTLASLYLLRVLGGIFLVGKDLSPWILAATFFLALFLSSLKRLKEVRELKEKAVLHRPVLREYPPAFLNSLIQLFAGLTIITYALYTFLSPTAHRAPLLMLTMFFVLYGVLRFWYRMTQEGTSMDLEEVLLSDVPLLLDLFLWGVVCVIALMI